MTLWGHSAFWNSTHRIVPKLAERFLFDFAWSAGNFEWGWDRFELMIFVYVISSLFFLLFYVHFNQPDWFQLVVWRWKWITPKEYNISIIWSLLDQGCEQKLREITINYHRLLQGCSIPTIMLGCPQSFELNTAEVWTSTKKLFTYSNIRPLMLGKKLNKIIIHSKETQKSVQYVVHCSDDAPVEEWKRLTFSEYILHPSLK